MLLDVVKAEVEAMLMDNRNKIVFIAWSPEGAAIRVSFLGRKCA